jgi:hypothetical protein
VGGDVINMGKIRRSTREARLAPLSGPALLIGSSIATEIGGAVQYPPAHPHLCRRRREAATLAAISLRRSFDAAL